MLENPLAQPVVVTGATGFVGRWLVRRLVADGHYVRALVLPDEPVRGLWDGPVEVIRGDVTDRDAVAKTMRHAGTIFHLAARVGDWGDEECFQTVTVGGTENVLSASGAANARIVLTSSSVVYGDRLGREVCDEDHPFGEAPGPYSRAKQDQEALAWMLARDRGLKLTVVRPANVFGAVSGPWVRDAAAVLRRGLPALIDGGGQNAGLCYVENLVDLLLLAASRPEAEGRAYNVCDGSDVTWRRYFSDLAQLLGARPPRSIPLGLAKALAAAAEALWRRSAARPPLTREAVNIVGAHHRLPIDRAREELGFEPRVTYQEAMRALGKYIREEGV
jgi:nucleoside-diphosphate-sugar epimerase